MKVLIVDPDSVRASTLQLGLATHGVEVTVASSGSFALTMLEWNRHEVVTSRARIGDMDGHELCAILKSDPGTRDVRFVLIAGPGEVTAAQTTAAGVDLVLPPTLQASAIVPLVMRLTHGNTPTAPAPPAVAPPPPVAPAPTVVAPRPYAPPRPVPPPVSAPTPAVAPATKPTAGPAPAKPAATAPAAAPTAPRTEILVKPPAPARPEPAPAVPKLRPDPVATPAVEPPKRYVTAAAAAAAAPWTKQPASGGPAAAPPAAPPPAPAINLDQMPSGTFQGSLQVMDLAELTQALAMGGKNGRLILALPQGGGLIVFEGRRVVHAEYRGATGEAAFAGLLTAAHTGGAGRFCFLPSAAGENPSPSRTINKSVDRLLLGIATAIDEKG